MQAHIQVRDSHLLIQCAGFRSSPYSAFRYQDVNCVYKFGEAVGEACITRSGIEGSVAPIEGC